MGSSTELSSSYLRIWQGSPSYLRDKLLLPPGCKPLGWCAAARSGDGPDRGGGRASAVSLGQRRRLHGRHRDEERQVAGEGHPAEAQWPGRPGLL
jgi:hypothetical protein